MATDSGSFTVRSQSRNLFLSEAETEVSIVISGSGAQFYIVPLASINGGRTFELVASIGDITANGTYTGNLPTYCTNFTLNQQNVMTGRADYLISTGGTSVGTRAAVVASVPADGSASVPVTYATPFLSSTTAITLSIINDYQTYPWALTAQETAVTASGFTLNVAGGPPGSTVSVGYIASGT
jgi:hypothetical protein